MVLYESQIRTSSRAFSTCSSSLDTTSASMTAPHPDPWACTPRHCHWEARSRDEEGSIRPVLVVILYYILCHLHADGCSADWRLLSRGFVRIKALILLFCLRMFFCLSDNLTRPSSVSDNQYHRIEYPIESFKNYLQAGQKTALAREPLSDGSQHLGYIGIVPNTILLQIIIRIIRERTWGRCS